MDREKTQRITDSLISVFTELIKYKKENLKNLNR